ncbi:epi-1 [Symbiodinium natans]|uniref:Epi-1 protein n=1 Tax=Symbiodinium natans TaxID=878477 RepID=A0A812U1C7_9DINO|nr:epi-1 [Symbiodinium natans]
MLLSDSVSQQKLQEQVKLTEEQLKEAKQEMENLSSSLREERSERQKLSEALEVKAAEAEACTERLASTSAELKCCHDELEDLRQSLKDSTAKSTHLHGVLEEHSQENANLKMRLEQREIDLERRESQVHQVSSELSLTSHRLTQTESDREAVERRLAETKAQLEEYEGRLTCLSASLEAAQRETASRSKRMELTSMAAEDFMGHLNISKARVRHLEQQARETEVLLESKQLEQQRLVKNAEEHAEIFQGKLDSLTSSLDQEQSQSAALRQELLQRDQRIEDLAASVSSSNAQVESLTEEKGSLARTLKASEEENEELKSQINSVLRPELLQRDQRIEDLVASTSSSNAQVEFLSEEKGSLARTLKAQEEENEELKSQISSVNQQVSDYERQVTELYATLSTTQLENTRLAQTLEGRAMEAEEFLGRIQMEKRQLAELEHTVRSVKASLDTSLTDKDDLTMELERTCLEREDLTQQLVRAQEKLVLLEEEVGKSFLKAAEDSKQVRENSVKAHGFLTSRQLLGWQNNCRHAWHFVMFRDSIHVVSAHSKQKKKSEHLLRTVIEKLNDELDHAKKRLEKVAMVDDAEMATLKEQLMEASSRLNGLTAAIDLKDTEMQVVSLQLMRKGMQAEDYLGQVRSMKDRLVQSEMDLSRFSSELRLSQMEKDVQPVTEAQMFGAGACGRLQHDLLSRQMSTKETITSLLDDSEIERLQCELTALRMQLQVLRSTLQEQLQQNELQAAELTKKRRDELSEAVDAKSDTNAQLQGLREEELRSSRLQQTNMGDELDSLADSKNHLEAKASRLSQICKKQSEEKEALSTELENTVGSVRQLQSQLAKYRQQMKEDQAKIDSLTRSLRREVQKKDEAATRCAELLCSHPSMCIEAWIGRVRTFRDTDGWQLVAGSGFDQRVILKGGDQSGERHIVGGEEKDRKEEDRVVQKPMPHTEVQLNKITVFDKMRRLFSKNRIIYDQNFGIVRPYPDGISTRSSSEAPPSDVL